MKNFFEELIFIFAGIVVFCLVMLILRFVYSGLCFLFRVLGIKSNDSQDEFLNQEKYYRFTKFVDNKNTTFNDEHFEEKLFKIKTLIKEGKRNIKEIADESGCRYDECVLKIKYLQNQHQLTQFHVDHKGNELIECTPDELKLIKKYMPFIYHNNFTLDEIVIKKRRSSAQDFDELREIIFKELKYLVDNDLVNDIKLNEVDKEIIYCTEEEEKRRDFITVVCPNCGALNDINKGEKKRCEYCKTILNAKRELDD